MSPSVKFKLAFSAIAWLVILGAYLAKQPSIISTPEPAEALDSVALVAPQDDDPTKAPTTETDLTSLWPWLSDESPEYASVRKALEQLAETHHQSFLLVEAKKHAQVDYLARKFKRAKENVRHYVDLAWEHAENHSMLEPELLLAIMQKESGLRPHVSSNYGAQGLMQVVPRFHREKIKPGETLLDPKVNVRVGAQVLAEYWRRHKGDWVVTLKRYSGDARGYPEDVLRERARLLALGKRAEARVLALK